MGYTFLLLYTPSLMPDISNEVLNIFVFLKLLISFILESSKSFGNRLVLLSLVRRDRNTLVED